MRLVLACCAVLAACAEQPIELEEDAGPADHAETSIDAGAADVGAPDAGTSSCEVAGRSGTCSATNACPTDHVLLAGACGADACCVPRASEPWCPETRTPLVNEGHATEAPGDPGCPAGMAVAGTICIDRYEASLVSVDAPATTWSPFRKPGDAHLKAVSVAGAVPQAYVNQLEAKAACEAAGKRLCSNEEWLLACRGAGNQAFPYGPTRIDAACNDESAGLGHPATRCFKSSNATVFSHLDDPGLDQQPDSLSPCGAHGACVTATGVFDLVGNLHEWTDDAAGTFRGGFFGDTKLNGVGCSYVTTAHDTAYADYSTGFRCCASRE